MMDTRLFDGIRAARAGQTKTAQAILADLVRDDPDNEQAWLWLATTVEDVEHKISCLQQALRINPNNEEAAEEIDRLQAQVAAGGVEEAPITTRAQSASAQAQSASAQAQTASAQAEQPEPELPYVILADEGEPVSEGEKPPSQEAGGETPVAATQLPEAEAEPPPIQTTEDEIPGPATQPPEAGEEPLAPIQTAEVEAPELAVQPPEIGEEATAPIQTAAGEAPEPAAQPTGAEIKPPPIQTAEGEAPMPAAQPPGAGVEPPPPKKMAKKKAAKRPKKTRRRSCLIVLLLAVVLCAAGFAVVLFGAPLWQGMVYPIQLTSQALLARPLAPVPAIPSPMAPAPDVSFTPPPTATPLPTATPTLAPSASPTPSASPSLTSTEFLTPNPCATPLPTNTPMGGGRRIAFVSDLTINSEVYMMNSDGSEVINLSRSLAFDAWPAWSPDGRSLLFASSRESQCSNPDDCSEVYLLDLETGEVEALTTFGTAQVIPEAWLPDGRIAVNASEPGATTPVYDLYLVEPESGETALWEEEPGWEWLADLSGSLSPRWSPDGRQVLISVFNPEDGSSDLLLANADGSEPISVVPESLSVGVISAVDWSPEGSWIAFVYTLGEGDNLRQAIYAMHPNGSGTQLLTDEGLNAHPSWSPDGSQIAFASDREGNWEIFIMNADGSGVRRVTLFAARDEQPAWRP
jgi:Tol biopolymer transport system component